MVVLQFSARLGLGAEEPVSIFEVNTRRIVVPSDAALGVDVHHAHTGVHLERRRRRQGLLHRRRLKIRLRST